MRFGRILGISFLLGVAVPVFAETIELVTYYPATANSGDLHVRSITVGTAYQNETPGDGTALIADQVGIGTNAPQGSLHVVGPDNAADNILFAPGAGTGTIRLTIGNGGLGAPVAEGTQSNGDKLVMWNAAAPGYKAAIGLNTNNELWLQSSGNNANNKITFYTSNASATPSERMRIAANGNVGIGTTAPSYKLDVVGTGGNQSVYSHATDGGIVRFGLQNTVRHWSISGYGTNAPPFNVPPYQGMFAIADETAAIQRLVIDPNGNVGIGMLTPGGRLGVMDSVQIESVAGLARLGLNSRNDPAGGATWNWYAIGGSHTGGPRIGNLELQDNSGAPVMAICVQRGTGNVGLGVNTPAFTLHVNGSAGKPGGGAWSNSSDIRLKKNVAPMSGALQKMLALRGVTFEWKDPASQGNLTGTQMGMIGQEVEKVFPEWVSEDPAGMKVISVRGFEALTVEAIRELERKVERLEQENRVLKEEVQSFKLKKG